YVDSAGIGALVGAYVTHQEDGRILTLGGVNNRVRAALQVTKVESFFRFFDNVTQAEAAVAYRNLSESTGLSPHKLNGGLLVSFCPVCLIGLVRFLSLPWHC